MSAPLSALTLWHEGREVGALERTADDLTSLRLIYHPYWPKQPGAFPISSRFPLDVGSHEGNPVYFWFMNLLPEDRTLKVVGALLEVSDIDVLSLVAELGLDLPGALQARPAGATEPPLRPRLEPWTEATLAADIRRLPERPLLAGIEGVQMSLAGSQAKLPVFRQDDGTLALPLDGHPSNCVLKPANPHYRGMVENEAFCLRLARACGLAAPNVWVRQAEDCRYLLVERYDRRVGTAGVLRLHQEDLCQALGFPPYRKYEWNSRVRLHGPKLADLFTAVSAGQHSARNRLDLLDYVVFNLLVCNVDSHAKNYSLLFADSSPRLAPIYDVMCGRVYEGITENLPQKIAGHNRGDQILGRHWVRMAREVGLAPAATRRRIGALAERVRAALGPLSGQCREETPAAGILDEIAARIDARCRRVIGNLEILEGAEEGEGGPQDVG